MNRYSWSEPALFEEVGRTHTGDPWTSRVAAVSSPRSTQRRAVLLALANAEDGYTDDELGALLDILQTAAGTRRKELEELGFVERTPHSRLTRRGNPALVHRITPAGLDVCRTKGWL